MRAVLPVLAWAALCVGVTLLTVGGFVGLGLRHVVWASPGWLVAAALPVGAVTSGRG